MFLGGLLYNSKTAAFTASHAGCALLFICILFRLIISLPWIHPVTDRHPTCIATSISRRFVATAPVPHSRMTHARPCDCGSQQTLRQTRAVQEFDSMAEAQTQSFTEEHKVMTEQKCLFRNLGCRSERRILEVTAVQKLTGTSFASRTRM